MRVYNSVPNRTMSDFRRIFLMTKHNQELINRLSQKPEVAGIIVHGSFATHTRHESDATSDLDITVVVDNGVKESTSSDPRTYIPWLNFKSYQAISLVGAPLEVDMYYFDMVNDTREWDNAAREGYAYSSTVVYDRDGKVQKWLNKHTELTPELRSKNIAQLMCNANELFYNIFQNTTSLVDKRITLLKTVKNLLEVIFYINWEYPPDLKWRVSGSQSLNWKPSELITSLGKCSQTSSLPTMIGNIQRIFDIIWNKLAEEGLNCDSYQATPSTKKPVDNITRIARLFTRIDKYSSHSAKKCVRRGLPWNAHDVISEGVENAIDIIYAINGVEIPKMDKFLHLQDLDWTPWGWKRFIYQASLISNYENADDALERATALRMLFNGIKTKIAEMNIFSTSSLYATDFMNEDLFSETSPYMRVFKGGQYLNRQQEKDTFAELLYKKVNLPVRQKNILFGMCSHYLLSNEEEFLALNPAEIHPYYLPAWEEAVKQLK